MKQFSLLSLIINASRVEKFKAFQAALEIKNEDHAGHGKVEIIGKRSAAFYTESFLSFYLVK
jgi:hypothetical protein